MYGNNVEIENKDTSNPVPDFPFEYETDNGYDLEKDKKYPLKSDGYRDYPDDFWVNSMAPREWRGHHNSVRFDKEKYEKEWRKVKGPSWVRYMDGRFTAEYSDEIINFHGHTLGPDTYDDKLWEVGVLRVVPFNFEKYKHKFHKAYRMDPRYRLAGDGRPLAIENFEVKEYERHDIMSHKNDTLNWCKDLIFAKGFNFRNRNFDLRFRQISYISLLGLRASHNDIPEDFEWYDAEGQTVTMNKETLVAFCREVTDYVRKVEQGALRYLNKLEKIDDLVQLANLRINADDLLR